MKLQNFLLGAGLAIGGASFGQTQTRVYIPVTDITLICNSVEITEDSSNSQTIFTMDVVGTEPGNTGPCDIPYLGNASGYTGPWGPNSTLICKTTQPNQCVFTQ